MAHDCASCFPPKNICPTITAASANSTTAPVGDSISLSAEAADPDDGPSSISFWWGASSTDAGDLGVFSEHGAARTSFTCELAGTTTIDLSVSDGSCTVTEYLTVTCTER